MISTQNLETQHVKPGTIISLEFENPVQHCKSNIIRYDEANGLIFLNKIKKNIEGQLIHIKLRHKTKCIIFSSTVARSDNEVAIKLPSVCTIIPRQLFERTKFNGRLEIGSVPGNFVDISLGGFCADMSSSLGDIQSGQWLELKTEVFIEKVLINEIFNSTVRGQFSILSAVSPKLIDTIQGILHTEIKT